MKLLGKDESKSVTSYLDEHPGIVYDYERTEIIKFSKNVIDGELTPALVTEIYDELGIIPDKHNIYLGFIEIIEKVFDIKNKRILEVGGGVIPSLGKKIALRQNRGNITIYDPRLSKYEHSTPKMKLVREKFTDKTDVASYDLLMGFMPCKAAEKIIDSALKNDKDFIIALCEGGPHGDEFDFYEDADEWVSSTISYADHCLRLANKGILMTDSLRQYNHPYPVIYSKIKK